MDLQNTQRLYFVGVAGVAPVSVLAGSAPGVPGVAGVASPEVPVAAGVPVEPAVPAAPAASVVPVVPEVPELLVPEGAAGGVASGAGVAGAVAAGAVSAAGASAFLQALRLRAATAASISEYFIISSFIKRLARNVFSKTDRWSRKNKYSCACELVTSLKNMAPAFCTRTHTVQSFVEPAGRQADCSLCTLPHRRVRRLLAFCSYTQKDGQHTNLASCRRDAHSN